MRFGQLDFIAMHPIRARGSHFLPATILLPAPFHAWAELTSTVQAVVTGFPATFAGIAASTTAKAQAEGADLDGQSTTTATR